MLNKTTNRYAFELTDHLGNVRAVVAKNASTSAVDVLSYTDYYPGGGVLPGRNFVSSPSYKMGYQGMEKDAETNFTNFELRQYDPRLMRWFNPDPMHQYFSPYLAMGNNPVSMVDPTGGLAEEELGADVNYGDWMDAGFNSASDFAFYTQHSDNNTSFDRWNNRMDGLSNAMNDAYSLVKSEYGNTRDLDGNTISYSWERNWGVKATDFLGPDLNSVGTTTVTPNPLIISKVHTKPYLMSDWDDYSVVSDGNPENVNQLINGAIISLNWLIDTWNSAVDATGTETMIKNTVFEIEERNASDYDDANYDRAKISDNIVALMYSRAGGAILGEKAAYAGGQLFVNDKTFGASSRLFGWGGQYKGVTYAKGLLNNNNIVRVGWQMTKGSNLSFGIRVAAHPNHLNTTWKIGIGVNNVIYNSPLGHGFGSIFTYPMR